MATDDKIKDQLNFTPFLSKIDKTTKKSNEGNTAQKILVDKLIIFCTSLVSLYSQIKPRIDMSGKEAVIAATAVNRFPSSETLKIIKADKMIFIK